MLVKSPLCQNCVLQHLGRGFSEPEGQGSLGVLILGDSLTEQDAREGLPFRPSAAAGSILERAIRRSGYSRQQFILYNLINCQPPSGRLEGESYEHQAIEHCRVHLDRVVERFRPRAILALGNVALRAATGFAGKSQTVSAVRGYILEGIRYKEIPVIPAFHPSFLRRGNMQLFGVLCADLRLAVRVARGELLEGRDFFYNPQASPLLNYRTTPSVQEATAFLEMVRAYPERLLTYDIETDCSTSQDHEEDNLNAANQKISQIQFSLALDTGIALPFAEPYIALAKQVLASPNPKAGHHVWRFDNPILRQHGFTINGRIDDTLWLWHHAQPDLPAGLQFVASFYNLGFAWKHLASADIGFYGVADVDAVQRIMARLPQQLREQGLWEGYEQMVYQFNPILEALTKRGYPVSKARQAEFAVAIEQERTHLDEQLQALIPDQLKQVHPKQGYLREPKDTTELIRRRFTLTNAEIAKKLDQPTVALGIVAGEISSVDCTEERWCRLLPFNPSSSTQVLQYICRHSESLPKGFKLMDDTASRTVLEKLYRKTKDEVYHFILELRQLDALKHLLNSDWQPASDGRLHPVYSLRPADLQLAVPLNLDLHLESETLRTAWQRTFSAQPGHQLLRFTYRGLATMVLCHLIPIGSNLEAWQQEVLRTAHTGPGGRGRLVNAYGCQRLFHEVRKYSYHDGSIKDALGEQAKDALAWLPTSTAACFLREKLLALEDLGLLERARLVLLRPEGLEFECPVELVAEVLPLIYDLLRRPSAVLTNPQPFACDLDVEVGSDLAEMKGVN